MGVTSQYDVFGPYWERRNLYLSYILFSWQWDLFRAATYFYRPLVFHAGYWHFSIYARYPHRDYFYFGRPHFYTSYRGGHSWRMNGGRSFYEGRRDFYRPGNVHRDNHFGMRNGFDRGDFRGGRMTGNSSTRHIQNGGRDGHSSSMDNNRHDNGSFGGSRSGSGSFGGNRSGNDNRSFDGSRSGNDNRSGNSSFDGSRSGNDNRSGNRGFDGSRSGNDNRSGNSGLGRNRSGNSSFGGSRSGNDNRSNPSVTTRPTPRTEQRVNLPEGELRSSAPQTQPRAIAPQTQQRTVSSGSFGGSRSTSSGSFGGSRSSVGSHSSAGSHSSMGSRGSSSHTRSSSVSGSSGHRVSNSHGNFGGHR